MKKIMRVLLAGLLVMSLGGLPGERGRIPAGT